MTYKNDMQRIIRLISWGLVTGLIGFALNGTTREEGLIPINKNLWYVWYSILLFWTANFWCSSKAVVFGQKIDCCLFAIGPMQKYFSRILGFCQYLAFWVGPSEWMSEMEIWNVTSILPKSKDAWKVLPLHEANCVLLIPGNSASENRSASCFPVD